MSDCVHEFGRVIDTRKRGEHVYRRRKCPACGDTYTTMEMAVEGEISNGFSAGEMAGKIRKLSAENRCLIAQLVDRLATTK